ncbi:MAG TPA: isoprenylcysteine carboxylmethyltransferase family protein [Steroidobacteraceae bacterium]|jgi:protein-S-isoprenylcysteine O-methyltransferase Ste14
MTGSAKTIYNWLIFSMWLVIIAYWAVSAISAKKSIRGARVWWREAGLRLGIFVLVVLALRIPAFRQSLRNAREYAAGTGLLTGALGVVLCAAGIWLAIWARVYLGRNWGMPMSQKEHPELVTSGPYAWVRHPIYAGMILAMFGSMIAQSIFWIAPLVLGAAYFLYSAWSEEKLMTEQFPNQYPAYRKRTKMFVPWVF